MWEWLQNLVNSMRPTQTPEQARALAQRRAWFDQNMGAPIADRVIQERSLPSPSRFDTPRLPEAPALPRGAGVQALPVPESPLQQAIISKPKPRRKKPSVGLSEIPATEGLGALGLADIDAVGAAPELLSGRSIGGGLDMAPSTSMSGMPAKRKRNPLLKAITLGMVR